MIKSKYSFTGIIFLWLITIIVLILIYETILLFLHIYGKDLIRVRLTLLQSVIFIIIYLIIECILIVQLKINSNIYFIDTVHNTITIKNYFTRNKKVYFFNDFEGYIDSFVKSPHGNFRILYLIQNGRLINKMSGRAYSNVDELEQALKGIKYLGFQKFTFKSFIKIILGKLMIN